MKQILQINLDTCMQNNHFTIGVDNNINCYNSEKKVLDKKYKIIKKNLDKYDQKFLKKINLKYIVLCEDLSISKINTAGIPDNVMKTLILDINLMKIILKE